jgi:hypothetical protein
MADISSGSYSDTAKTASLPKSAYYLKQGRKLRGLCGGGVGSKTVGGVVMVLSRGFIKDSKRLIEEVCCTA